MVKRNCIMPQVKTRRELEALHGRVWDVPELAADYILLSLIVPGTVVVRRRSDGVVGTLTYQPDPCLYFGFVPSPPADL